MKHTVQKLPKSEVSIDVSIPADIFDTYKDKAIARLAPFVEVAGFRKGKAPANLVEKQVKPSVLLEEMAEEVIGEKLSEILRDEKIDAIGRPMILLKKLALGNPLEFTATVAVMPVVKLPDYKKIAKAHNGKEKALEVTDEELTQAIVELKKARNHQELHDKGVEHSHEEAENDPTVTADLTDEYVQALGPFKTVAEFKEKFRENILNEKTSRENQVKRVAILDEILEKTEVEMPNILVDNELEQLIARIKHDVEMAGMQFADYLTQIQKTEADMRTDLLPDAEKRARGEIVLYTINKTENLTPKEEEIEKETATLMNMYMDADKDRTRAYVTQLLANEAVFKFFDEQK